jgi:hypothetical protein
VNADLEVSFRGLLFEEYSGFFLNHLLSELTALIDLKTPPSFAAILHKPQNAQ